MINWKFRKGKKEDFEQIWEFRNSVIGRDFSKDFIRWMYLKGQWGPADTWFADYNGKIIGQCATLRYEAFYFGKKIKASLAIDGATHPDYRRQGILHKLGAHQYNEEGKQKNHFTLGFPNENYWPRGKKFFWHALCKEPLLENKNITELNIEKTSKFEIIEIQKFEKEFKRFSENYKDEYSIFLNRTINYLNWRFVENPRFNYFKYKIYDKSGELVGYFVLKYYKMQNIVTFDLVDFLFPNNEDIYKKVLYFIYEKAKKENIKIITTFVMRNLEFYDFLLKFGFLHTDRNRVVIIRNNTMKFNESDLFDEKNHFVTMADSDIF